MCMGALVLTGLARTVFERASGDEALHLVCQGRWPCTCCGCGSLRMKVYSNQKGSYCGPSVVNAKMTVTLCHAEAKEGQRSTPETFQFSRFIRNSSSIVKAQNLHNTYNSIHALATCRKDGWRERWPSYTEAVCRTRLQEDIDALES